MTDFYIKTADELDNSEVGWLIDQWIPKKGIVLLSADGGVGKSHIWVSIASSLSKGESTFLRYDPNPEEKTVLCFSAEDSENILRHRFESAGAKLENIRVIAQDSMPENLTFDSEYFRQAVEKYRPCLTVFDPLQAFLGVGVDMSRRNHMRHALQPLLSISSQYDMPILIVLHTNKRDADGRNKLADSSDIWDIARSVLMCGFTSDKERYISLEKASYTNHLEVPTFIFDLDGGKVNVIETSDKKMADFVQERKQKIAEHTQSKQDSCADSILLLLAEHPDGLDSQILFDRMIADGFKQRTIERAKKSLCDSGFIDYIRNADKSNTIKRLK